MTVLKAREAILTTEVVDLLKQNGKLLKDGRKDKVDIDALKKELGKAQKSLDHTRLRLMT